MRKTFLEIVAALFKSPHQLAKEKAEAFERHLDVIAEYSGARATLSPDELTRIHEAREHARLRAAKRKSFTFGRS